MHLLHTFPNNNHLTSLQYYIASRMQLITHLTLVFSNIGTHFRSYFARQSPTEPIAIQYAICKIVVTRCFGPVKVRLVCDICKNMKFCFPKEFTIGDRFRETHTAEEAGDCRVLANNCGGHSPPPARRKSRQSSSG